MKILKNIALVLEALMFIGVVLAISSLLTGCSTTPPPPETVIVTKYKEVKVPVRMKYDIPEIKCDFSGKGYEPTTKLLDCLMKHITVIETLRKKK